MATLDRLLRSIAPEAARLTPASQVDRAVAWVRVMRARVPAFDALEADDLVIVPERALSAIVHEGDDAAHVADELARAGVAGTVLLLAPDGPGSNASGTSGTQGFIRSVVASGISAYRLEGGDEVALERAAIGYLVNERAEIERQVGRLESTLQALALAGRGVQEMAAAVATFFHRAVAIEDRDGALIALFAPPDSPASTVAAARYEAHRGAAALRGEIPGGGSLALIGEAPPSDLEEAAASRVAILLALEFARETAVRRVPDRGREALPAAGPPWVVVMARQIVAGDDVAGREDRRRRVAQLAPARRLLLRGDAASVELRAIAAAPPDDPRGQGLAGRIGQVLGRPVAVSRPFDDPTARPQADAEARSVLEAADGLEGLQAPSAVLRADRLPVYRLLGSLHNLPDGERHARALLAPLLTGSPARQAARLATLRAALDGAGPAEAAVLLGVHRNTVAYRIRALEAATGWDLSDPDLRLALSVALRFVRTPQI